MKEKDRDITDDLFRSKLRDMEVDVAPQDWEKIADRLPRAASIPLYRRAMFWTAAAVSLLVAMSGLYLFEKQVESDPVVQEIQRHTDALKKQERITPEPAAVKPFVAKAPLVAKALQATLMNKDEDTPPAMERASEDVDQSRTSGDEPKISPAASDDEMQKDDAAVGFAPDLERQTQESKGQEKAKSRRWGFGMGAGGVSVGTGNVVPGYLVSTMGLRGEDLLRMNAPSGGEALPKTDVHHNKPLSFGLGVSYYLSDRFALSSGLTYTYLSSEWKTNDEYKVKTTQKLHFIGVPLGLTYKIAEWRRFNLYTSAGFQMDINVGGQQKGELIRDALQTNVIDSEVRSVRDRKLLFSANAKAGVSYPLLRFVSAYAEAGVGYYFNNGGALFDKMSKMPTIYSEKPLNFTLQAGFRLGF
ncbi:MAG: PorT family protein [Tannerellaceae bacterium]|jgi:opacity protein-like surface antigen|nr:PorT family protein [Tannerellaceae bacterium]